MNCKLRSKRVMNKTYYGSIPCFKIRPHRSVGAGRARGAFAFELVTFAKTLSSHIAVLGGHFWSPRVLRFAVPAIRISFGDVFLDDFWLCFAFPAMGISVLEEMLVFDWFFAFILLRLEGHRGERFGGVSLGCFWQCLSNMSKMIPYSLQHTPKIAEIGLKMAPTWPWDSRTLTQMEPT